MIPLTQSPGLVKPTKDTVNRRRESLLQRFELPTAKMFILSVLDYSFVDIIVDMVAFCAVNAMNDISNWKLHQVLGVIPSQEVILTDGIV